MTLLDVMNGPVWIIWSVFAIFTILTVIFLSGHGSGLIAGYNTTSDKEQKKYDEKKLCKVMGCGMAVISILLLIMAMGINVLPVSFIYLFIIICIFDCVVIIILSNTICKH